MLSIVEVQELVQKKIDGFCRKNGSAGIYQPVNYILSLGGKRLRPALSILSAQVFTDEIDDAVYPAIAVEIFHNFTLMHDDIMDEAPLRRGKATVHEKWNSSVAILSGDAMMIQSYQLLRKTNPEKFLEVYDLFNKTAIEVCEGQQLDMDFEKRMDVTLNEYIEMIRLKTSVLLAGAMKIGAIIGGADSLNADRMYRIGEYSGLAFQLLDDYLDVFGDQTKVGKQEAGDIISDKKTYLLIKAIERAEGEDAEVLKYWIGKRPKDPTEKVKAIKAIFSKLEVDIALKEKVMDYHDRALSELDAIKVDSERKKPIYDFAETLIGRQH
ncbi:MAG: polyprenyl synthetase family protein [Flavobacteriales bacterium]